MIRIHYIDDDVLVAEKPAGIPTQPLSKSSKTSLAGLLAEVYPELKGVGGSDWGAVHRLDVDTSGLVVLARSQDAYTKLRAAFSGNEVEKEYTALVVGKVSGPGKIEWPIGPDLKSTKRVRVYRNLQEAKRQGAQEASTFYRPLPMGNTHLLWEEALSLPEPITTLLQIRIKTGRRHQIRVHLAALGHPIVGDKIYGGPTSGRLYLHASGLQFEHPRTRQVIRCHSLPF